MTLAFDHVLFAVRDLDVAARRFETRYGLASIPGGVHPAFGTGNRIVPLGDSYLELITVTDPAVARANPLGRHIGGLLARGEGPLGWVVRSDDIDADAARLGIAVVPGYRARPDGTILAWRAAGMETLFTDPSRPFFIAWDDAAAHPGVDDRAGGGIAWIEVGPSADLAGWLGANDLDVRIVGGDPGPRRVGIARAAGEIIVG